MSVFPVSDTAQSSLLAQARRDVAVARTRIGIASAHNNHAAMEVAVADYLEAAHHARSLQLSLQQNSPFQKNSLIEVA